MGGNMAEKKSALSFLKSAFIQELPEVETQKQTPSVSVVTAATKAVVDEKARQTLLEALEANRLDSYDYLKFRTSLQELASDIPDERLRYKTVFATAKAMGVTKDKLIQTANHYVLALDEELKKFNEAVGEQIEGRIIAAENKVSALEADLKSKDEEIKKINEYIAKLTAEKSELVARIAADKSTIESRKTSFVTTHLQMVEEIKTDTTKLANYLG